MRYSNFALLGLLAFACSEEDSGAASTISDAALDGQGGVTVVDGSFGGFGGTAGADASTGGASTGGSSTGGGPSDAAADVAPEAPFVCDVSGPLDCSAASSPSYDCGDPKAALGAKVTNAVKAVLAQNPTWFDFTAGFPCCPKALQPQAFRDEVVKEINASGACASVDPNNPNIELVVKLNNKCSEQWVILTSANIVRNPPKYQGACAPAWL